MSKTGRINHRRGSRGQPKAERRITVRSVPRSSPDLGKLSRAVIAIALREAALANEEASGIAAQPRDPDAALPSADQEGSR